MADGSLIFDTQIDSTGISRFASIAKTKLKTVTAAATVAGTALTAAGTYAVGLASDLTEVQNVVDTTFGDNANVVNDWAKSAAESFGMSELQAKQFNGTMGAMLTSMGMTNDEVLSMSTSMSGLAGDMASFYNLDAQDAFDKIRSGISGETEPLKQLGINMSVANLEAYAMSQGIKTAYSEMSQAEQATLRYEYLMQATAKAQGDFSKTSDSLANQLRILKLNVSDVAGTIGTDLMPMVQDGVSMLNSMINDLGSAYETGGFDGLVSELGTILGDIVTMITDAAPAVIEAGMSLINNLLTSIVENGEAIGSSAADLVSELVSGIMDALPILIGAAQTIVGGLAKGIGENLPELIPAIVEMLNTLVSVATDNLPMIIDAAVTLFSGLYEGFIRAVPTILEAIPEIIMKVAQALTEGVGQLIMTADEMSTQTADAMTDTMGESGQWNSLGADIAGALMAGIMLGLEELGPVWWDYWEKKGSEIYWKNPFTGTEYGISDEQKAQQEKADKDLADAQDKQDAINTKIAEDAKKQRDQIVSDAAKGLSVVTGTFTNLTNAITTANSESATETEQLQTAWADLQHKYATGVITSDEDLYAKKIELLKQYGDKSNADHNKYYEDIYSMEQGFTDDSTKQAEDTAKKELDVQEKLTTELQKAKQKQLDVIKDSLKKQLSTAKDNITDTISAYKSEYATLYNSITDYKSKLLGVGDVFTVTTEKDKNGKDKTTYAVEDINKQIKDMEAYNADVKRLKEQGASQALISEVTGMGFEEGSNFANYLDNMSNEEFAKINELYTKRQEAADELSKGLYADEAESLETGFISEVEAAFGKLPEELKKIGEDGVKAFLGSFVITDEKAFEGVSSYFDTYTQTAQTAIEGINLDEAVKTSLSDADMATLGQTAGQQFTEAFNKEMESLSVKLISGVQAEQSSTSASMTSSNNAARAAALTSTAKNTSGTDKFTFNIDLTTQTNLDGEVVSRIVTRHQKTADRQKGQ